jgi:homocysteine S-methyltransferase
MKRLVMTMDSFSRYADAFNVVDLRDEGRWHLGTVLTAVELKRQTGLETIPVLTLRDSNLPSLMGSVAYAVYGGIQNIALVRGDPYPSSSETPNVYQLRKVSSFVRGVRSLLTRFPQASCDVLAPISLNRGLSKAYVRTLIERQNAGTDLFLSDPAFGNVEKYLSKVKQVRREGVTAPILHNIFPLRDENDILFCKSRFGWDIPAEEIDVVKDGGIDGSLQYCRRKIEDFSKVPDLVDGLYISSRGRFEYFQKMLTEAS